MGIKRDYVKEMVSTILQIDPKLKKDEVEAIVIRKMKERMMDPSIVMDNNVTGQQEQVGLSDMCNWIDKHKPVISGNATFYMQPSVLVSPTSRMLRILKRLRKEIKKLMFKFKPEDDEYQRYDLDQGNAKVVMNAEYGASGAPMAAFYNKYGPAATTLMAQSIITTMAAFFEGYVGDNQKFYHINECMDWMNTVRAKKEKIPRWIQTPTVDETSRRIKSHFILYDSAHNYVIDKYLNNCQDDELTYLFYANNMKDFIRRHPKMKQLIQTILLSLPRYEAAVGEVPVQFNDRFPSVEKYNKWVSEEMFMNPYNIPAVIKDPMGELTELMNQFCFVEYLTPDSIVKLNNHKRKAILLVDTDSNVINANIFVDFVMEELFPEESFQRGPLYNDMICVNILASVLDKCVINILDHYGKVHNMDEEARTELAMKNEFMFRRFFLMLKKKRYATSIALREGNIMYPFKTEIKGLDFIKAGVTDDVTKKFTGMLENYILFSEELELHELMREIKRFEKEIREDLENGGVRYLKPQSYKSEGAYKKVKNKETGMEESRAWSIPVFRAAQIWNELYPQQKIYSLDKVKIVKLMVTGLSDLEVIKQRYPDDYKLISDKIFHSNQRELVAAGLKVIAIPSTVEKIPDWLIPLIDYDVIISDVIASFRSVLEALKIEEINLKTPNGKAGIISSLISI